MGTIKRIWEKLVEQIIEKVTDECFLGEDEGVEKDFFGILVFTDFEKRNE